MLSRLGCSLSRLAPGVARGALWRSSRSLSTSQSLLDNATTDPPKPVLNTGRTGLTGFLEDKTGVTGAGTLLAGLAAYMISKEIYIINGETINAVIMAGTVIFMVKKFGKPVSDYIDGRNQRILDKFYDHHNSQIKEIEDAISDQKRLDANLEVRHDIFSVLRENNAMQLEEEYRRRWHEVNSEVMRRLDYQVEVQKVQKAFEHSHLVQWLEKAVIENVKGQEDASINQCITDLKKLAAV